MLSKRKKDYVKIYNLSLCTVSYFSQYLFVVVSQFIIIHRYKTFLIGSRFFLTAAEFFWWPGQIILPGVGNTAPLADGGQGRRSMYLYRVMGRHSLNFQKADRVKPPASLPSLWVGVNASCKFDIDQKIVKFSPNVSKKIYDFNAQTCTIMLGPNVFVIYFFQAGLSKWWKLELFYTYYSHILFFPVYWLYVMYICITLTDSLHKLIECLLMHSRNIHTMHTIRLKYKIFPIVFNFI